MVLPLTGKWIGRGWLGGRGRLSFLLDVLSLKKLPEPAEQLCPCRKAWVEVGFGVASN